MTDRFVEVVKADDLPEKKIFCTAADGVALAVVKVKGSFYAVENQCSHAAATFDDGRLRAFHIICPLHGGMFDVRTGAGAGPPARRPIRAFPTRVNGDGMVEVNIDNPLPFEQPSP
ncbi:MAG: Rieske 2Fe-2S domain-containing protein [Pseudomonadota bacterium]